MGVLFYREVRKRADLEKELAVMEQTVTANEDLAAEVELLETAVSRAQDYIDELQQEVVNNLGPVGLADAITRLFNKTKNSSDTDID